MATQPNALAAPAYPQSERVHFLRVTPSDSEIISASELDTMTDNAIVEYAAQRIVKFAMEIRPVLVKVHERFMSEKKANRPFLGYTNFDQFCLAFWNYTGRQIRNIINGTPTPKRLPAAKKPRRKTNRQVVEEGIERQQAIEVQKAREKGFEEGQVAERKAQEILNRKAAKSGAIFDPNPGVQLPSLLTAELTISWAGTIAKLKALTKSLKSESDEFVKTEARELARTLRNFSKDAADRAERLEEALRMRVR
jgi:hypothetical protein